MVAKGRGGGKTPPRVAELLINKVSTSSQAAVSRDTGLTRQTIQRYMAGIGEPSNATLQKLADYSGFSVAYLRGETPDSELFKSYPYSAGYDIWAIMLSSAETTLTLVLNNQTETKRDELSVKAIIDIANKYAFMTKELSEKFHPEHLSEVKALAIKALEIFNASDNVKETRVSKKAIEVTDKVYGSVIKHTLLVNENDTGEKHFESTKKIMVIGKADLGFSQLFGDIIKGKKYLIDEDKFTDQLFERVEIPTKPLKKKKS